MMTVCRAFGICTVLMTVSPTVVPASQPEAAIHQVTKAASLALRREALANEADERESALRELIGIHDGALAHSRFSRSASLQRTVLQIRVRLRRALREIQQQGHDHVSRLAPPRKTVLGQRLGNLPAAQGAQVNGANRGGQQGGADFGPELVDLIQRTISPPLWEVNGGLATIVYFQPRLALVVRATQETHRDLGNLLVGLRAAGGP
jgi:hypothetical protein